MCNPWETTRYIADGAHENIPIGYESLALIHSFQDVSINIFTDVLAGNHQFENGSSSFRRFKEQISLIIFQYLLPRSERKTMTSRFGGKEWFAQMGNVFFADAGPLSTTSRIQFKPMRVLRGIIFESAGDASSLVTGGVLARESAPSREGMLEVQTFTLIGLANGVPNRSKKYKGSKDVVILSDSLNG